MSKDEPIGEVEFMPILKPATPDMCIRGILGISLAEFIDKVRRNEKGEYDSLYEESTEKKCV